VRPVIEGFWAIRDFIDLGGNVLFSIMLVTFVMWALILERYIYLRTGYREALRRVLDEWHARKDKSSWYAHQIRRELISRMTIDLDRGIPMIKTLVALCPLLGLLGTVTGMIEVFQVMSISGSGNPRAMASGVSKATIPTMAGMVAAISGVIFSVQLERRAKSEAEWVADELRPED
jgi:biopolymer transport protein ExbB